MLLILSQVSSLRGVLSIGLGSLAYLSYFQTKNDFIFFKKFFMLIILIIFAILFSIVFFDFSNYQSFIDGAKGIDNRDFIFFKIIDRLIKSFVYFQSTFKEIVFNNNFDMTYSYGSGLRLSGL